MGMIGKRCPSVAGDICGGQKIGKAIYHVIAVFFVVKYLSAFDGANDNMVNNHGGLPIIESSGKTVRHLILQTSTPPCQVI